MAGLYYEDFRAGMVFDHEWSRTVTEMDNVLFSSLTMNTQPLHIDAHYSEKTEFGRQLVNSLFTLGLMIGMSVNDTTSGTVVANLGITEANFPNPVFHGDTLKVRTRVESMRKSKSRPDNGIVEFAHSASNQRGEEVANCHRFVLVHCRPGGSR